MRIRLKEQHWEIGRHYERFIDRRWHSHFEMTAEALEVFMRVESAGRSTCSGPELTLAAPLFNGKACYELTIKMIIEEMADWWSGGNGWFYPIAHTIRTEMWSHSLPMRDRIYIRALVKIMRACHRAGFISVLTAFTGMSDADKQPYLKRHEENMREQLNHTHS